MISKKEIQHIAKLARLSQKAAEIRKREKEMVEILNYIEKLKEVEVEGVEATNYSIPLTNVMRKDEKSKSQKEWKEKLLSLAPEREGDYWKAPKII